MSSRQKGSWQSQNRISAYIRWEDARDLFPKKKTAQADKRIEMSSRLRRIARLSTTMIEFSSVFCKYTSFIKRLYTYINLFCEFRERSNGSSFARSFALALARGKLFLGIPAIIYQRESAKGSHAEREEKGKGEGIARIVLESLHGLLSRPPQSEAAVTVIPDIFLLPPAWMHRVSEKVSLSRTKYRENVPTGRRH